MSKIAILTDSACDIPQDLADKHHIDILPFYITVDGQSYVEREDLTFEGYYDLLTKCQEIPKTSQITPMRFEETFCAYDDAGYTDVLYVSINSTGSATYNNALLAREQFREERPDSGMEIHVVDSHSYSMGYGWPLVQAAQKLKNGADIPSVLQYLEGTFAKREIVLAMYTLKFAKKSGRISAAAAFAGELLGLKPLITLIDGVTKTQSKVRGDLAVMPALVKFAREHMDEGSEYLVGGTDKENIKVLAKLCKKEYGYAPAQTFLLGAAVSTNTGPNAVAIVYAGPRRR